MQQTQKYQLNLIETSDTFSPDSLNENTQKVEAVLQAEESARVAQASALTAAAESLSKRIRAFEARHVVVGSYVASLNGPINISLGFNPKAVLILGTKANSMSGILMPESPICSGVQLISNGFQVSTASTSGMLNRIDFSYGYVAFD